MPLRPPAVPFAPLVSEPLPQPERLAETPQAAALRPVARRPTQVLAAGIVALALFVGAIQVGGSYLLAGRVLPGVSVAGEQVGGLTAAQAEARMQSHLAGVRVRLDVNGTSSSLTAAQVGAHYDLTTTLSQALVAGRTSPFMPVQLFRAWRGGAIQYDYSIDQGIEHALAVKLTAGDQVAQDATITVNNGVPTVQPDRSGRGVTTARIESAIASQLANPSGSSVKLAAATEPARITANVAAAALPKAKQLLATPITITAGTKTFTPTTAQKGSWLAFTPSAPDKPPALIPAVSTAGIKQYIQALANQVNVAAVDSRVNILNGSSTQTAPGQNGSVLNADALADTVAAAVTAGQPLQTAAPMTTVPYQTITNSTVALPYAQYIEINLTSQHLWAYQDNKLVYDSPVTSGATGAGFPTVTGMFSILAKQTDRHLVGYQYGPAYNYDVFVQYWMQFYEGYGLHDASWRNGNFGGQDYYHDGSHGCVNLPLATAAWLYNWSSVGTPVWVHK